MQENPTEVEKKSEEQAGNGHTSTQEAPEVEVAAEARAEETNGHAEAPKQEGQTATADIPPATKIAPQAPAVDLDALRKLDKAELIDRLVELSRDKQELERKRFVDNGLSRFTEIMRLRVDSTLENWAENLLLELVPFVNGLQAAIFMLEQPDEATDEDDEGYLRRIGGYALPEDALDRLGLNHGLTGQVARTGDRLYYQTPEYFRAHTESSLSRIQAKVLLVQPLVQNERVEGVLEITAIQDFEPAHLEFIEALSDTIAGNLITLRSQVQIQYLYKEAQERQEQLEAQEDAMRQNLEQLQQTQEEMKLAQLQSAQSEARVRQFMSEIPVGIVVVDAEGKPFFANRIAVELLGPGISPDANDEEAGRFHTRKRAYSDESYPEEELPLHKALQGESASVDDLQLIISNKRVPVEVTAAPIYNEDGDLLYAIATYKDITEVKEREREISLHNEQLASREEEMRQNLEELEATQEQMREVQSQVLAQRNIMNSIMDSNSDAIIAIDNQYKLLSANAAVRASYEGSGLQFQEGDDLWDYIPQEQQDYYSEAYGRALSGERFTEELSYEDGGEVFYFASTYYPIKGDDGKIIGAANQTTDVSDRRRAEEEIRGQAEAIAASEEELRQNLEEMEATRDEIERVKNELTFQDNAIQRSMAVIEFDVDGYIRKANDNFQAATGYTLDEIVGKHHSMFVEPEYAETDEYLQLWRDMKAGKYREGEVKRVRKDGSVLWLRATYNPVMDTEGKPFKVIKFASDITEEKLAEQALREQAQQIQSQEEELRQSFEEMEATREEVERIKNELQFTDNAIQRSTAVIEFDVHGNIQKANKNFQEAVGYSREELEGQHHRIFCDPEYAASEEYKQLWEDLRNGKYREGEVKRFRKDGSELWLRATYNPVLDADGRPYKVVKLAIDITQQKKLEAELQSKMQAIQSQEEELRQSYEEMEATREEVERVKNELQFQDDAINRSTAVIEFDVYGNILRCNKNFEAATGYSIDELKGQHHRMFCDPEYAETDEYKQLWLDMQAGQFREGEVKRFKKDGSVLWLRASYNPILNSEGKPYKVLKLASDITAQKQQEQRLRQQTEQIQAQEEELRQSLEEMEATREEVERIKAELEHQDTAIHRSNAVIEFDVDGNIRRANKNFLEVVGYTNNEIEGRHHRMFVEPAEAASPEYREFWAKLKRGEFLQGTYKRYRKDGSVVWLNASYNPILNAEGVPYKIMKFALDVTEQKEREQQMRQQTEEIQAQEEELRQSMEEMEATREEVERVKNELQFQDTAMKRSTAYIEFDVEGNILTANELFLDRMCYKAFEVKGKHHRMFVDPEYAASDEYREFWEKLKAGEFFEGEYRRIDKQGDDVWIRASYTPVLDQDGKPYKVMKIAKDITEQKRQEQLSRQQAEELAAQEEELRQSFEEMEATREEIERIKNELQFQDDAIQRSTAVIEFDVQGNILRCNKNFEAATGYTLEEIQGRHHQIFVDPEYAKTDEYKQLWLDMQAGKFRDGEVKRFKKDGSVLWLRATYNPVMNADGVPYKVIKLASDITGEKLQEEKTRQQAEEIQAQEEELRQNMEEMQATQDEVLRLKTEMEHIHNALNRSNAIVEFDLDGYILHANKKFLDLMGYDLEEVMDEHHKIFVSDREAKSKAYKDFWAKLGKGQFLEGEYRRRHKDGSIVRLQASYNPILDEQGVPYKIIKFATPVKKASTFKDDDDK